MRNTNRHAFDLPPIEPPSNLFRNTPLPEVREDNSERAWDEWNAARAYQEATDAGLDYYSANGEIVALGI